VHGSGATVVAGIESGQQVDDLGATHLTDDDAVGPHPQRLPNEIAQGDGPGTFDVRGPRNESDDVRMRRRQLGRILDTDDALARVRLTEKARQNRGLDEP
jgi:hypothetical protein